MSSSNNNPDSENHKLKIEIHSPPAPGEWGWMMSIHGQIYSAEYGFNSNCELYVGQLICELMPKIITQNNQDSSGGVIIGKNNAWIGTVDGQPMGCICCTEDDQDETIGKLRILLVCPEARGLGLGSKLINECISFAKSVGYKKLTLWTHGILVDARALYDKAGFRLVSIAKHSVFGPELDGHVLELDL